MESSYSSTLLTDSSIAPLGGRVPSAPRIHKPSTTREVAEDFEQVFLAQMLKPMFESVKHDGMFGGGHAEGVYRDFLTNEYARLMNKNGGIGLADNIEAEMIRIQESQQETLNATTRLR